jgi:hypothetical protein
MFPITITINNAEELAAVQAAFLGAPAAPVKPKRAAAAAAPAAAPVVAPVAAPVVAPVAVAPVAAPVTARSPTADTAAAVTPAQIKAAGDDLSALAEADRAQAVAILGEFGVQKMTAMPPANIPEFHNRIKAALARLQGPATAPSLV